MSEDNIQKKILQAIEAGQVKMKPRWYFVLHSMLLFVGGIFLLLGLVYLISFIVFVLRQSGLLFVPTLGIVGIRTFLSAAPWVLLLTALVFVAILHIVVKRYAFGYSKPLLYSTVFVIIISVLGGVLVEMTPLHRGLLLQSEDMHLPLAGGLYRQFMQRSAPLNVTIGKISGFVEGDFTLETREGDLWLIKVGDETQLPKGGLFVGESVIVLGERAETGITALGVRKFFGVNIEHSRNFMKRRMEERKR